MKKYLQVWTTNAKNNFQVTFLNRWASVLFIFGKLFRFGMMLLFLLIIKHNVKTFSGYTTDQVIVFFLVYQFVDLVAQILYRGVYTFTNYIRSGDFDFLLAKPISPLFQALTDKPDFMDLIFLAPVTITSLYLLSQLDVAITPTSLSWFLVILGNSFAIVTAFHILILATGILITEVDGVVWLYRDLSRLGQFPISIYMQPLKFILFFLVPIGMMITIPAEILLGLQPTYSILIAILIGIALVTLSMKTWKWSLKKYSSASS